MGVQIVEDAPELAVITGAAAQIAGQECPDFIVRGVRVLPEQGDGIHHEAGVAEAALVGTLVSDEAHKVRSFCLEAFQGVDLVTVGTDSQSRAGQDGLTIHQHRAKTAVGSIATALDTKATLFPEEIQQDGIGFHGSQNGSAVEFQFDFHITYLPVRT